jgi:5-hydroxyisourate hydrolase
MDDQPTISTHVLDTEHGWPAKGVTVNLYRVAPGGDRAVGSATTDDDGRVQRLLEGELDAGDYRIEFTIGGAFFGTASFTFKVADVTRSYHVPLLMAPFSLATYRGS